MQSHPVPADFVELCCWSLPATRQGPQKARAIVGHELEALGLGWAVDDVALGVSELVDNVAEHTECVGCRLVLARSDIRLRVGVEDCEPDKVADVLVPTERARKGLGLRIVEAISVAWGCDVSLFHKSVWFELPLSPARPSTPLTPTNSDAVPLWTGLGDRADLPDRGRVPAHDPDPTDGLSSPNVC